MKIFVSVCSYRDPLLKYTIRSLLDNKSHRHDVTIGILEQTVFEGSLETLDPELVAHPNVRYKRIDPIFSEGVGWARHVNALQVEDEDLFYQVDSHMLFDPNWDRQLVNDWRKGVMKHNTNKIIITGSCKNFDLDKDGLPITDEEFHPMTSTVKYFEYQPSDILGATGMLIPATKEIEPSIYTFAGNFFTHVEWLKDVGINPRIFFDGEEQWMMLKSFMEGYKIYHPRVVTCYHYINTGKYITKQWHEPIITDEQYGFFVRRSVNEFKKLIEETDEDILEAFHKYSGVDYINKRIDDWALLNPPEPKPLV